MYTSHCYAYHTSITATSLSTLLTELHKWYDNNCNDQANDIHVYTENYSYV